MTGPGPDNARTYPRPGTQPARLLAALLNRLGIDPLIGWRRLGIYRLSDTVFKLRHEFGWQIENVGKDVKNRFGEACRVARYVLPPEEIEAAGERGRAYVAQASVE